MILARAGGSESGLRHRMIGTCGMLRVLYAQGVQIGDELADLVVGVGTLVDQDVDGGPLGLHGVGQALGGRDELDGLDR